MGKSPKPEVYNRQFQCMQRRRAASNFFLSFFFFSMKEKGKNCDLSNASSVLLSFLSLDSCRSGKNREESKKSRETLLSTVRIFPRCNFFARSLDDDTSPSYFLVSSVLQFLRKCCYIYIYIYIVYSILNTEYAYTAILSTDKSIHLYIRDQINDAQGKRQEFSRRLVPSRKKISFTLRCVKLCDANTIKC